MDEVFRSAFRLKEKFIVGPRPYDTDGVEEFLKKELGDDTKFSDIKKPRYVHTVFPDLEFTKVPHSVV